MTKKQESPYQISLDIPDQLHQSTDLPSASAVRQSHEQSSSPLDADHDRDPEYEDLEKPGPASDLYATQISLLDDLSGAEPEPAPQMRQDASNLSGLSSSWISHKTDILKPAQIAIAPPTACPIPEPYLLPAGSIIASPGGHFSYRILGACCRLFDRDELPWPCCRIQWHSKEPSWRRIGKRFVPDLATKRFPSYMVEILDHEYSREPFVLTLYWLKFPANVQNWWYTRYVPSSDSTP